MSPGALAAGSIDMNSCMLFLHSVSEQAVYNAVE